MRILTFAMVFLLAYSCSEKKATFYGTLGTGSVKGLYYPIGSAIARMINNNEEVSDLKLQVNATEGSVSNINEVTNNMMNFGLVQADRQYQAIKGLKEWKSKGPRKNLRALFSLHTESVTLVTRESSRIKKIQDLKGKFVNLGNYGSGQLQNSKDILNMYGLSIKDVKARFHSSSETPWLLKDGHLDAYFYTVGHPNTNTREATTEQQKMLILDIKGKEVDAFLKQHPYYTKSTIPIEFYPKLGNLQAVETIGVKATLVTNANMPEDKVYKLVKHVFENIDEFKKLHPALKYLTKQGMLKGLTAPLHPGAVKYYKEAGLL